MSNIVSTLGFTTVCAFGLYRTVRRVRWASASEAWPTTTARILRSRVKEGSFLRPGFSAHVAYRYHVDGIESESECISALDSTYRTREAALRATLPYVTNEDVLVHYSPSDPSRAVLEPGVPLPLYLALFMGVEFVCFGSALSYYQLRDLFPRP